MQCGHLTDIVKDGERERLDARGRRVLLGVAAELSVKAEIKLVRHWLVTWVRGPHAGEALTDGAEVVLHCARANRFVAGVARELTDTDAVGKDLEDTDLVRDVEEQGLLSDGDTKLNPDSPVGVGGGVAARNDAGGDRFFCKAEVTAELIGRLNGQSTQDSGCGYVSLK